jgi:hypothetical protein
MFVHDGADSMPIFHVSPFPVVPSWSSRASRTVPSFFFPKKKILCRLGA